MKRIASLLILPLLYPSIAIADHTYSYRSCTDEAAIGRKLQLDRLSIQYNMLIESGNCTGAREFARAYIPETLHKEGPTCPLRISGVILNAYLLLNWVLSKEPGARTETE